MTGRLTGGRLVAAAFPAMAILVTMVAPVGALERPTRVCPVPASLSAETRAKLQPLFTALAARQKDLDKKIADQERDCKGVRSDETTRLGNCETARVPIERAWRQYEPDAAAYLGRVRAALDAELADATQTRAAAAKRRETTRRELRQYIDKLPNLESELQEWGQLTENARLEARDKALGIVASYTLDRMLKGKKEALKLTRAELDRIEERLSTIDFPAHTRAFLSGQGSTQFQLWRIEVLDRRAVLRLALPDQKTDVAVLQALKELVRLTTLMESSLRLDSKETQEVLKAVVPVMKMFVRDPVGKLIINDVELGTSLGYLGVARAVSGARLAQLDALTAKQFEAIRALGPQYEDDVAAEHEADAQVSRLEGARTLFGKVGCQ